MRLYKHMFSCKLKKFAAILESYRGQNVFLFLRVGTHDVSFGILMQTLKTTSFKPLMQYSYTQLTYHSQGDPHRNYARSFLAWTLSLLCPAWTSSKVEVTDQSVGATVIPSYAVSADLPQHTEGRLDISGSFILDGHEDNFPIRGVLQYHNLGTCH